jgi:sugar/nucleoside kinase (ribokinase family)
MQQQAQQPLDVIGVGLATLDVLIRLEDMPTWESGGRFDDIALDGGGLVGTALVAASRLGLRCGYLGTAGSDEFAHRKLSSLSDNGVDTARVAIRPGPEEAIVICYVDRKTGERVFSGRKGLGNTPLQVSEIDRDYITSARYLHLDGFHPEAALQAARWMREAGGTVCFDGSRTRGPVGDSHRAILEHVDVLVCGEGYLRALSGCDDVYEAGRKALTHNVRVAVETRGAQGCYSITPHECFHTPAFEVGVVDTTGAGDVFHGAYLAGLHRGWSPRTVALYAGAVSAIKCTRLGGRRGIPRHEDVVQFMAERGHTLP